MMEGRGPAGSSPIQNSTEGPVTIGHPSDIGYSAQDELELGGRV